MTRSDRFKHALLLIAFFVLVALFSSWAQAQTAPSLTFTLETTANNGQSITPRLTWSTTPAASSCTASGSWTGTKAASGTQVLAAVTASQSYAIACSWPGVSKISATWTMPTTNTDGSPVTNLAGTRVMYGNSGCTEDKLTTSDYVQGSTVTSWTSPDLAPGTWCVGLKAFNAMGLESPLSNTGSKATTAASNLNRSLELGIKFPGAPVLQ